jgi:5-dehydro-2-deoxygluconokinase
MKPDWWKLEPQVSSAAAWAPSMRLSSRANDPFCRGVVLLGLDAPQDELEAALRRQVARTVQGLRRRPHAIWRSGQGVAGWHHDG